MQVEINLNPVTNPAAMCLGLPLIALIAFALWIGYAFAQERASQSASQSAIAEALAALNIDRMTMREFRDFVKKSLAARGYVAGYLSEPDELGTALVASKNGRRTAIHAIRYGKSLSPRMVREAAALRDREQCDEAMVITNARASEQVRVLARSLGVVLVAREQLAEWISAN